MNYLKDLLLRITHKIQAGNNHELLMKIVLESLEKYPNILKNIHNPVLVIHDEKNPIALPIMVFILKI